MKVMETLGSLWIMRKLCISRNHMVVQIEITQARVIIFSEDNSYTQIVIVGTSPAVKNPARQIKYKSDQDEVEIVTLAVNSREDL